MSAWRRETTWLFCLSVISFFFSAVGELKKTLQLPAKFTFGEGPMDHCGPLTLNVEICEKVSSDGYFALTNHRLIYLSELHPFQSTQQLHVWRLLFILQDVFRDEKLWT